MLRLISVGFYTESGVDDLRKVAVCQGQQLPREHPILVEVRFKGTDLAAPALEIKLQRSIVGIAKASEELPAKDMDDPLRRHSHTTYEELVAWVGNQLHYEGPGTFERSLSTFLMCYAFDWLSLPKVLPLNLGSQSSQANQPKQRELAEKTHKMYCFYRIYTASFSFRGPNSKESPLPVTIQLELRAIAKKNMKSLEKDVLNEFDKFLKPDGIADCDRLPVWACIWQMILIYRDMLSRRQSEPQIMDQLDGMFLSNIVLFSSRRCRCIFSFLFFYRQRDLQ